MELFCDLETFCEVPITYGTHRYAETAEVMLFAFAEGDDAPEVWDLTTGEYTLDDVAALLAEADKIWWHNSAFDRTVLKHRGVVLPVEKVHDTMVTALQHSLPGKLEQLCEALGLDQDKAKDKDGRRLIQLFCKPRPANHKLDRATRLTHPEDWERFKAYAGRDIDAMRECYRRMPRWNLSRSERELWLLDQRVNDRGIAVDKEHAACAYTAFTKEKARLNMRASLLTHGGVTSLGQNTKVIDYLDATYDYALPNVQKGTISALLKTDGLEPEVRELLSLRQMAAATSPAKYNVVANAASADGRLRGLIQFCGAGRTGRDAGRVFQPQNLPRPSLSQLAVEQGVEALKLGCADLMFENVAELCISAVRGCLVAEEGKKLAVADLSNIEGRVLAWGAGEDWKLKAFADYDAGIGHDLYVVAAGRILNVPPEAVTKLQRQNQGKVSELACLGSDTRVLTSNGVKTITKVTTDDLLWDGIEWVRHEGLVSRGCRYAPRLDGVAMTLDHRVLADGNWLPAEKVASYPNFLDLALVTGTASLLSLTSTLGLEAASALLSCDATAEALARCMSATCDAGPAPAATPAPSAPADGGLSSTTATLTSAPTTGTDAASATASLPASTGATTPTTGATPTTAGAASTSTNRGEPTGGASSPTSSVSPAGTDPSLNSTEKTSTGATNPATCASSPSAPTTPTAAASEFSSYASPNWRQVYDIARAGPRTRFTVLSDRGAFIVHNCGYQGAVGAFNSMGKNYGVVLAEDEVLGIVRGWRRAHPNIVSFWYAMDDAAKAAIRNPGHVYDVNGVAAFDMREGYLRMELPSGRFLSYKHARIDSGNTCHTCIGKGTLLVGGFAPGADPASLIICDDCYGSGRIAGTGQIVFEGLNQYTRQWATLSTYGGKLAENWDQGTSRDIFMGGLKRAEAAGYLVVMRVHDELICEVPDDPRWNAGELSALMARGESWTLGLPLAAAGHTMRRYAKLD